MNIRLMGVPANMGALHTGTEKGPKSLRQAGLIEGLEASHRVIDLGDLMVDNHSYRHNHPPIRNWPGSRVLWDQLIGEKALFDNKDFTLVLGGGCNIFTGVFRNFHDTFGADAVILSIDHHIDMRAPSSQVCMGATAFTLWFLTHDNPWIPKPFNFNTKGITAMGFDETQMDDDLQVDGMKLYSKQDFEKDGVGPVCQDYLDHLDPHAKVIIHFDLDVIAEKDLSSVYMPSSEGMAIEDIEHLLQVLLQDGRIRAMVVTEFSPKGEVSEDHAERVVAIIQKALTQVQ